MYKYTSIVAIYFCTTYLVVCKKNYRNKQYTLILGSLLQLIRVGGKLTSSLKQGWNINDSLWKTHVAPCNFLQSFNYKYYLWDGTGIAQSVAFLLWQMFISGMHSGKHSRCSDSLGARRLVVRTPMGTKFSHPSRPAPRPTPAFCIINTVSLSRGKAEEAWFWPPTSI
jgi:hypothetical protein